MIRIKIATSAKYLIWLSVFLFWIIVSSYNVVYTFVALCVFVVIAVVV